MPAPADVLHGIIIIGFDALTCRLILTLPHPVGFPSFPGPVAATEGNPLGKCGVGVAPQKDEPVWIGKLLAIFSEFDESTGAGIVLMGELDGKGIALPFKMAGYSSHDWACEEHEKAQY